MARRHPSRASHDRTAPLIVWVNILGARKGDRIAFAIHGPGGATRFRREAAVPKDQARRFVFADRKAPPGGWPSGDYHGTVELIRSVEPKPAAPVRTAAAIRLQ